MRKNNHTGGVVILCAAIVGIGLAGHMDAQDEARAFRVYCDMHDTWLRSDGEHGWPDYKGIASDCPIDADTPANHPALVVSDG